MKQKVIEDLCTEKGLSVQKTANGRTMWLDKKELVRRITLENYDVVKLRGLLTKRNSFDKPHTLRSQNLINMFNEGRETVHFLLNVGKCFK